ncbi:hypothetical protein [Lactobacillus sp. Sy-1]|uniref:hypothetical protein n=1 Tax=Lactobacillus sp. Sy-1 TaxID=2109645 RepID=UPI001C5BC6DD|nr:hypothetical protein [Lactobacillus sp. Sy-1]MBW1606240.1 hypothetical protein [Lactobacillus sp. Sy-1]
MIQWDLKPFSELTLSENHAIQQFISVNGNNPADRKAYHGWALKDDKMIAYVRIYELDGDLTFDRVRFSAPVKLEQLVYRVLEAGSRFFNCEIARIGIPFDETMLGVYDQIGFKENDGSLTLRYYQ